MTHQEHQPSHEPSSMSREDLENDMANLILTTPGEGSHRGHPAVWIAPEPDDDDPHSHGEWVCLGHAAATVRAAIADATAAGYLRSDAEVRDAWGFDGWTPMPGDDLDTYLLVAQGITVYGTAFAAWADMVVDPDMMNSFPDFYVGTYNHPTAWAEETYGDEIEEYLDRTIRTDLRPFITADYSALADYATKQGRVCLWPGTHGELHAFNVVEAPRRRVEPGWRRGTGRSAQMTL